VARADEHDLRCFEYVVDSRRRGRRSDISHADGTIDGSDPGYGAMSLAKAQPVGDGTWLGYEPLGFASKWG
jgi:hypothetical protein